MARAPLAAKIRIDPSFSDGYESNHYGGLAEFGWTPIANRSDGENSDAYTIRGIGAEPAGRNSSGKQANSANPP